MKTSKDICVICKKEKTGKQVYISHHTDYDKDITIRVCRPCHNWLHGRQVYGHPFKTKYGKDLAPLAFAYSVVKAYRPSLDVEPHQEAYITKDGGLALRDFDPSFYDDWYKEKE